MKLTRINRFFAVVAAIIVSLAVNASASTDAKEAMNAYKEGKYEQAIELFNQIIKEQGTNSELLYNLGNAYSKAGDAGRAVLNYERALRLNPHNKKARNNLEYTLNKVHDANRVETQGKPINIDEADPSFFGSVKSAITESHTSNEWAVWAGVAFLLCMALVALYIYTDAVVVRKVGFFGAILSILCCIVFVIFASWTAKQAENHDTGVLLAAKSRLLSTPKADASPSTQPLTKGTRLQILETEGDDEGAPEWYKVQLNSSVTGWVNKTEFEPI